MYNKNKFTYKRNNMLYIFGALLSLVTVFFNFAPLVMSPSNLDRSPVEAGVGGGGGGGGGGALNDGGGGGGGGGGGTELIDDGVNGTDLDVWLVEGISNS